MALPFPLYQVRAPGGRGCRRRGRSRSYALPPAAWGTTVRANPHHRGRSNGCRFAWGSFAWLLWYCSRSGGDQQVVLPAGKLQDLSVGGVDGAAGIRLQDGVAALCGDLIDGEGAVGGGVVAHGVRLSELREL